MKKLLSYLLSVLILLTITSNALAQTDITHEEKRQSRCDRITGRIEAHLLRYDAGKNKHFKTYQKVAKKLAKIIEKLQNKGVSTSLLEEDLVQFDLLVSEFEILLVIHIEGLETTQSFACGTSEGKFVESLKTTRDSFSLIREKAVEIRKFYRESIREHIKSIRSSS